MQLLKNIEVNYLRSIHRLRIKPLGDLTVFSGVNDVGKSNILKALNLFFNNQVNWLTSFDFYQDFSLRRLNEVRLDSIKGRQFISIAVELITPSNYRGSLPPTVKVKKSWFRDGGLPQESNNLDHQNKIGKLPSTIGIARRMLTQFLNRVSFEYIPAIRSKDFFRYILEKLQETLIAQKMQKDDPILQAVQGLNINLGLKASSLRKDFGSATGIEADVSLPVDPYDLFRTFSVSTKWRELGRHKKNESETLSLSLRGDGIQARYVSSLLNYIAENSSHFYLWGFEEPENSIEYNLAIDLANEFEKNYSEKAQIFVTSHSPAFLSLNGPKTISYRVYKDNNTTEIAQFQRSIDDKVMNKLADDIGLFRIQNELHKQYLERRQEALEIDRKVKQLQTQIAQNTQPNIFVEGKTDELILNTAWEKLFSRKPIPFIIKDCDPLKNINETSCGGTSTLVKLLASVQPDQTIVVGIFDRDDEGIRAYEGLPAYFKEVPELDAKVSENRRAVSFLLPVPPGKEKYSIHRNLIIEFFFSDDVLSKKTEEGLGLVFKQPDIETKVNTQGGKVLKKEESTFPHTRKVTNGKMVFAESIVPNLRSEEFELFISVFDKIQIVLDYLQNNLPI